jgi:hypothetical protein
MRSTGSPKHHTWQSMSNWKRDVLDHKLFLLDQQKRQQEEFQNKKYCFTNAHSEKILKTKAMPRCERVEDELQLYLLKQKAHQNIVKREMTPSFQPKLNQNKDTLATRHLARKRFSQVDLKKPYTSKVKKCKNDCGCGNCATPYY